VCEASLLIWEASGKVPGCSVEEVFDRRPGRYIKELHYSSYKRITRYVSKVKLSHYTPWRHLGGEGIELLLIHDLDTRWGEWSASRLGRLLTTGKGPPVPISQEAGWASESVWTMRLEEKSFAPAGDRTTIARSSGP
jgi:hypothetical protein